MTNKMPIVGKRYRHKQDRFEIKVKSVELLRNDYFVFPEGNLSGWNLEEFSKEFEELPEAETKSLKDAIQDNLQRFEKEKSSLPIWAVILINQLQAETKPETQSLDLSHEAKEAMEELKGISLKAALSSIYYHEQYKEMRNKVDNLLNALDKQFANNKIQAEEVADNKIEWFENEPFSPEFIQEYKEKLGRCPVTGDKIEPNEETLKSFSDYEKGVGLTENDSVEELFEDLKEESIWKPVSELPELDPTAFCCYVQLENDSQYINAKYFAGEFYTQIFHPDMSLEKFRTTKISKAAIKSFCTLTDFINHIESLAENQKKLEERLTKLENKYKKQPYIPSPIKMTNFEKGLSKAGKLEGVK